MSENFLNISYGNSIPQLRPTTLVIIPNLLGSLGPPIQEFFKLRFRMLCCLRIFFSRDF